MAVTPHDWDLGAAAPYGTGWVGYDLSLRVALSIWRIHGDHPLRHRPLVMSWNYLSDEQHAQMIEAMREDMRFVLSDVSPYELTRDERSMIKFWLSLRELQTVRWQDCPDWARLPPPLRPDDDDDPCHLQ